MLSDAVKLQRQLDKKRLKIKQLYRDIEFIAKQLRDICNHRNVQDYIWEHDTGKSIHTGRECMHCGKRDPYNKGQFDSC